MELNKLKKSKSKTIYPFILLTSKKFSSKLCQICGKRKWQNRATATLIFLFILQQGLKIQKNQSHQIFSQEKGRRTRKGPRKRKAATFDNLEDEDLDEEHKGKKFCKVCGTCGYTTDECTTLKALIRQAKQKKCKQVKMEKTFTKYEVYIMIEIKVKKAIRKKKTECVDKLRSFKKQATPAKRARFEKQAQASYLMLILIIVLAKNYQIAQKDFLIQMIQ